MGFSVLMSIYHKENDQYLKECLQSLVDQTVLASEVIIVEDGPLNSRLTSVIDDFRCKLNIVSVRLDKNYGLATALNEGFNYCSYNIIARMDSDDVALPCRFEIQVKFMEANPDIAVSSGMIEEWNQDMSQCINIRKLPLAHTDLVQFAKSRSPISHPAAILNKKIILSCGGYPNIYPEDYFLWCSIINSGYKIENLDATLLKMRCGDDFISRRGIGFLKGEVSVFFALFNIGFISLSRLFYNVISRSILRLSPVFLRKIYYKYFR